MIIAHKLRYWPLLCIVAVMQMPARPMDTMLRLPRYLLDQEFAHASATIRRLGSKCRRSRVAAYFAAARDAGLARE
jgi:hypothetical protein